MLISDKPVLMDFNHFQVFSLCSTTQAFWELFSFESIKCFFNDPFMHGGLLCPGDHILFNYG